MITLEQLRDNYILPVLETVPFKFNIFVDTGDYKEPERRMNAVTEYINGVFSLTQSEVKKIGGGLTSVALVTSLKFLLPCGDETDIDGTFPNVTEFRTALSEAFSKNQVLSIETDGVTYAGGVAYSLPTTGMRAMRQGLGDSIEYVCTIAFSYLENALNASEVRIYIDGAETPYMGFLLTRKINTSADLYRGTSSGEASVYAENSIFTIDFETPASNNSAVSKEILRHITGSVPADKPHSVRIDVGDDWFAKTMIFGECTASGAGVSNVVYKVSLLPYAGRETIGG